MSLRESRLARYAGVAAVLAAIFGTVACTRFLDGDEGFYLVAARLVSEGHRPYADFFYLQMPLLPYALAGWLAVAGPGWIAARLFSAALATALGVLVFHHVARSTRSFPLAVLATLLFAGSGLSLGWFTPVKTYALAGLLLFAGFAAASSERRGALLWCGVFLGLATSVRLYLLVAAPCVVLHRARSLGGGRPLLSALGVLSAGFALGLFPCVPSLLLDREAFLFDTFTFHSLRYPRGGESLFGRIGPKIGTLLGVLGLFESEGPVGIQNLLLFAAALAGCLLPGRPRSSLAQYLWVAVGVTSLLPNPAFHQYFCLVVPFLAVSVAEHAARVRSLRWRPVAVLLLLVYLGLGAADVRRFVKTGERVPGVEAAAEPKQWSIPVVEEIGRGIDRAGADEAASFWPGYLAFTRTRIVPEMANDFAVRAASKLSAEQRAKFHIPTEDSILGMIRRGSPAVFVEGHGFPPVLSTILPSFGYRASEVVHGVRIWVHPAATR